MAFYHHLIRPLLFHTDPEWIHDRAIQAAELPTSQPRKFNWSNEGEIKLVDCSGATVIATDKIVVGHWDPRHW
ncbi:MAG: hypothetical protein JWR19_1219 [Pedosphaera sp.]|nr:hypothetical protein [Pedosphaera sp.]